MVQTTCRALKRVSVDPRAFFNLPARIRSESFTPAKDQAFVSFLNAFSEPSAYRI